MACSSLSQDSLHCEMNGKLLKLSGDARSARPLSTGLRSSCKINGIGAGNLQNKSRPILCQARSPVEELELEGEDNEPSMQNKVPYNLGYSFTPGGLLVPYYIGVAGALRNLGMIGSETPISGSSAGAICAAMIASGLDYKECLEANKRLQLEILQNGTFQKLQEPLRNSMMDVLPDDIHHRANGKIGIAVTIYRTLPNWKPIEGRLLDTYTSKSDMVDAIVASCYIPYYLGPAPGLHYRGEICSDGLPTNFFPEVVESSKHLVDQTVTVSAMPYQNRFFRNGPGVDISPDNRPESDRFSAWGYIQRGVLAYSLDDLELLAAQGYEDATKWGETFLSRRILARAGVL